MKEIQFYKYATIALLLLNLLVIGFFVLSRPNPGHNLSPALSGDGGGKKGVAVLSLDKAQDQQFIESAEGHKESMDSIRRAQGELLNTYFKSVLLDDMVGDEGQLVKHSALERRKISQTVDHFEEVKSILNEDQKDGFRPFLNNHLHRVLLGR